MEPSYRCKCKQWSPQPPHHHFHHHHHHHPLCPHHHHHHHHLLHCPHHHLHLHHHHFNSPSFAPLPPQNLKPVAAAPLQNNLKLDDTVFNETHNSTTQMFPEEEHEVLEEEEEEDDEPIFVLTDEWREFFAKSEAKRKLEKKQAKKK